MEIRKSVKEDAVWLAAVEMLTMPEFAAFLLEGLFPGRSVGAVLSWRYGQGGVDSYEWSWVAQDAGRVVGAIGAYPVSLIEPSTDTGEAAARIAYFKPIRAAMRADAFHIARLGVLDTHRRQGLARALIETALSAAGAHGERRATLFVWEDNAPARALYAALGFGEVQRVTLPPHPRMTRSGDLLLLERAL